MSEMYFARESGPELAEALMERVIRYDNYVHGVGLLDLWRRSTAMYYQSLERGKSSLGRTGEQSEYSTLFVNQFRNILQHIYITTISNRPSFLPRGINNSYRTRAEVKLATGLLDYYFDDLKYEKFVNRAAEGALCCGEWFLTQLWDEFTGQVVAIDQVPKLSDSGEVELDENGETVTTALPIYSGDPKIEVHSPADVIRDPSAESFEDCEWLIVRRYINRWTLAAMYPEHRRAILDSPRKFQTSNIDRNIRALGRGSFVNNVEDTDTIEWYLFVHRDTPAVPNGRIAAFVNNENVLFSSTLVSKGYDRIPVYRISNGDVSGYPFGYTFAFDLIALQEILQVMYSTITTNVENFGIASIIAPKAAGIKASILSEGLRLIEFSGQSGPTPLELGRTPTQVYDFVNKIEKTMETLSGVNSVARGNPEASLESGAALALVQSQHIQFTQSFQQSYAGAWGDIGTALVVMFQAHVTENSPKQIAIVGRNNRSYMRELSGKDIGNVRRVIVDMGNYLSRTPAGRVELAQQLVQAGMVKRPEEFMEVLQYGRLEPILQAPMANADLIQSENEMLLDGKMAPVIATDNHLAHIIEHQVVGADPAAREDGRVMEALDHHIQAHLEAWRNMQPELAQAMGLPVLAPPAPGVAPGPAPEAGASEPAPPGAEPSTVAPTPTLPEEVELPTNPLTNAPWNPQTGGL